MMENGTPKAFDRKLANNYIEDKMKGESKNLEAVVIKITVGNGENFGTSWGCDLSKDYVMINSDYTT